MEKNELGTDSEYQENLTILRQVDFFSGLPLEAAKVLAYLCLRVTYKAGDFLFQQRDEEDQAYFVIAGRARLLHEVDGRMQEIRDVEEGEFLGRLALMSKIRRLFSLEARTDMICLTITREKFIKALEQFPDLMPKLIKVMVDNIVNWEKHFIAHYTADCHRCFNHVGVSVV
ncbi:MAG: cyclic nucleotide-binding domain-containing protein [Desulfobacterales bacterium]